MRYFISLMLLIGINYTLSAQTPASREWNYYIGYIGNNAVRPGLNFALEYGIADAVKLKSKVKKGKGSQNYTKVHQLITAANLGFIWHPQTATTLLNTYTLEYRKTTKRRMQIQVGVGGSYRRDFFPNAYYVNEHGEVFSRILASSGYGGINHFVGYGRYRKENRVLQWWHFRITSHYFFDYNAYFLPYLTAELRLGFHKKPVQK